MQNSVAGAVFGGSRVTLLAPRIVLDVSSYVTQINHEIHFAWQAQYLVKLECHFSWHVQHLVTVWEIAGARNLVFLHTKYVSKMGHVRSPKRRVRDDDFMVGSCSDYPRIVFILAEAIQGILAQILNSEFCGRGSICDFSCSAHCTGCFICDAD